MLDIKNLKNFCPIIMTPSHDGKVFTNYLTSLINLQTAYHQVGIPFEFYLMQGESLITRARNNCVAHFLKNKKWTHLFWIDSDIGFRPEAALRLLLSDHDVVAGIYPLKQDQWPEKGLPKNMTEAEFTAYYCKYPVNAEANERNEVHLKITNDGFIEVTEAPTGFMLIKRSVFEKMIKAYPELAYSLDGQASTNEQLHYRFFDVMVHPINKRYYSEDYGFCYLWNQLGGKIYIDAHSSLSHQGSKLYKSNFAESLSLNFSNAIGAAVGAKIKLSKEED